MATLRVVIEGMALWMDRGSYWEVLFPRARRNHQQHVPRMTVQVGRTRHEGIPLVGQTLDLLHLSNDDCGNIKKSWMLSMPASTCSPASDDQVATTPRVVSSVLLPRLKLEQVSSNLTGPVDYDNHVSPPPLQLDFGTQLSCKLEDGSVTLIHRDRTTGAIADTVTVKNGSKNITVKIQNFTKAEHDGVVKYTKGGDTLHDVQDLLALCGLKLRSPRYTGKNLGPGGSHSGGASVAKAPNLLVTHPYKLCPQGDGS